MHNWVFIFSNKNFVFVLHLKVYIARDWVRGGVRGWGEGVGRRKGMGVGWGGDGLGGVGLGWGGMGKGDF